MAAGVGEGEEVPRRGNDGVAARAGSKHSRSTRWAAGKHGVGYTLESSAAMVDERLRHAAARARGVTGSGLWQAVLVGCDCGPESCSIAW